MSLERRHEDIPSVYDTFDVVVVGWHAPGYRLFLVKRDLPASVLLFRVVLWVAFRTICDSPTAYNFPVYVPMPLAVEQRIRCPTVSPDLPPAILW